MLQMEGQNVAKANGGARQSLERSRRYEKDRRRRPRKKGENVIWRRIKDNIDDLVVRVGTNPEIASVVSRLVLYGHLTKEEGAVATFYTDKMNRYARLVTGARHSVAAQDINSSRGGVDVIALNEANGTIADYEKRAKSAKRQHDRIEKVLQPYMHGRDVLDDLCLNDNEINPAHYPSIKAMLALIAAEFGMDIKTGKTTKPTAKKGDVRAVSESAVDALANAAKRHKIAVSHFDVKGGNAGSIGLYIYGSKPGEQLSVRLKLYKVMPEIMTAALYKACEAKGWKAVA